MGLGFNLSTGTLSTFDQVNLALTASRLGLKNEANYSYLKRLLKGL